MEELLQRLDEVLTSTPLSSIRIELQALIVRAYSQGAMDFKTATDNVMRPLAKQMEQYHAYVAEWEKTGEAAADKAAEPRPGAQRPRR